MHANLWDPQGFLVEPRREPACPAARLPAGVRATLQGPVESGLRASPVVLAKSAPFCSQLHSRTSSFCPLHALRLGPRQLACSVQRPAEPGGERSREQGAAQDSEQAAGRSGRPGQARRQDAGGQGRCQVQAAAALVSCLGLPSGCGPTLAPEALCPLPRTPANAPAHTTG